MGKRRRRKKNQNMLKENGDKEDGEDEKPTNKEGEDEKWGVEEDQDEVDKEDGKKGTRL